MAAKEISPSMAAAQNMPRVGVAVQTSRRRHRCAIAVAGPRVGTLGRHLLCSDLFSRLYPSPYSTHSFCFFYTQINPALVFNLD
ncbi:unnamed protein product [Cuscuta campestris]|uniref:Uncharacterized protein n=1 Tax=Cuscuta campestris TaxID=132261 RepID=A0A484LSF0_9ASTE|nr:unnamed protein product [Cuscuta campestris]